MNKYPVSRKIDAQPRSKISASNTMSKPISLSVSIATNNSAQTLQYTLSSIFSNNYPAGFFEVVIADKGSRDNTVEIAKRFATKVCVHPNMSVGFRRNLSIRESKGEIICFTDSDIIVPPDWLGRISDYFNIHPDVDGVGGPILPPPNSQNEIQKYTGDLYVEDQHCPTNITKIDTLEYATLLPTANMAVRKSALMSVGGFPEQPSLVTIDMPLMWKLVRKGHKLVFLPDWKVIHLGFPTTLAGVMRQQYRWGKNKGILDRRYRPPSQDTLQGYLKAKAYPFLTISRAFANLFSPLKRPKKKELLRLCHYMAYYLGENVGHGIKVVD